MRIGRLHQFVPTFEPGAVGAHILELQRLAHEVLGVEGEVFAEHVRPAMGGKARSHKTYGRGFAARDGDVLVYHMAIGSDVADFVRERPETLVVDHHNVTPAHLFERWEPGAAYGCSWGRAQLPELAGRASLGVADSPYNEEELKAAGYRATATAPILLDLEALAGAEPDAGAMERLAAARAAGGSDWLFVGRVSPHKFQHDVVKAFAAYRRLYDPDARLHLVGGSSSDTYLEALKGFAAALGIAGAVSFTGSVSAGALAAHYRSADVLVCLSEHEGFGIPLLEAMAHGVPVVAYSSTAVPGTVGDAGIVLESKAPATVAAAVNRVVTDPTLSRSLIAAGVARLQEFSLERIRARWVEVLTR
ncbi:MAG TPA: glycosyltransferase family 4 protein [Acidimicrobiales bacterium]|nr:glycosyltransferase family 4 protein [Acidimicrobiales bacterium]